MRIHMFAAVLALGVFSLSQAAVQTTLYVSPTGTGDYSSASPGSLSGMVAKVRTINSGMTGDIVVQLAGGRYEISSTIALTAQDGGANGHFVIYQAAPGQSPVISGGTIVTGWAVSDAAKNIYKANIGTLDTRQLYVNGKRAARARGADYLATNTELDGNPQWLAGWSVSGDGYNCPAAVTAYKNLANVEVLNNCNHVCFRGPIQSATSSTHVKMLPSYWAWATTPPHAGWDNVTNTWGQWSEGIRAVENAYELLDQPGEWYLDKPTGDLFYIPRQGENMATAEAIVPKVKTLMTLTGLSYVQVVGLTFCHSTWVAPNTLGYGPGQSDKLYGPETVEGLMPLAISLDHCKYVRFQKNTIEHMAQTALGMYSGCQNCSVFDNVIRDISGGGVRFGSSAHCPAANDVSSYDTVSNNFIRDIAVEWYGSCAIMLLFGQNCQTNRNEIRHCSYTGVSMGYAWDPQATCAQNNEVAYNRMDSLMLCQFDGAGVYGIGQQAGTTIHDNYISAVFCNFGALYMDYMMRSTTWSNNVCVGPGPMWGMLKETNTVKDNYVVQSTWQNGCEPEDQSDGGTVPTNTVCVNSIAELPAAAQTIMKNAGRITSPTQAVKSPLASGGSDGWMTMGGMRIALPAAAATLAYSIADPSGRMVHRGVMPAAHARLSVEAVRALPAGVHYVKVLCQDVNGRSLAVTGGGMIAVR